MYNYFEYKVIFFKLINGTTNIFDYINKIFLQKFNIFDLIIKIIFLFLTKIYVRFISIIFNKFLTI